MMWRDQVELGNAAETVVNGETIKSMTWRTVFANKRNVRQIELSQAADTGLKPELVFEVRTADYAQDERLKHNGKEYTITRVEERADNTLLTVAAYVGSEN